MYHSVSTSSPTYYYYYYPLHLSLSGSALAADGIAAQAFFNTNTSGAVAMLVWLFIDRVRGIKPSVTGACVGCVVGLVAITPGCGYVTNGG